MALRGKEVADAFIDVHGDLSNFRKDLEGANAGIEKLARQQAQSFTDAFNERLSNGVSTKWNSIVDAMYTAGPIDVNKLIGDFNATGLDDAQEKINKFLLDMSRHQKITGENYQRTKKALNEAIEGTRQYEQAMRDMIHTEALAEDSRRTEAERLAERTRLMEEAIEMNRLYERSFEGMSRAVKNSNLESDFRSMAEAMATMDFTKLAKGFDSLQDLRRRVTEVTAAMHEMGRITDANAQDLIDNIDLYVALQEEQKKAAQDALDAAREAREEQERYNKSLEGMVASSRVKQAEADFRNLADAMAAADFSVFTRGNRDIDGTAARLRNVVDAMQAIGRVSKDDHKAINIALDGMVSGYNAAKDAAAKARDVSAAMGRTITGNITRMDLFTASIGYAADKLKGLGGFNVLGDMLTSGRDFFLNIDRHAVAIGKMALQLGTAASFIGDIVGGIAVLADDMVGLAGIGWLAPAFLTGAGIGIGVLVAAFKDMKTVLGDLGPEFGKLQDVISEKFWEQAEEPIRNLTKNLLPTLTTQLAITSTRLGSLFAEFASSFQKEASPERVTGMFEKMNAALDRVKAAVAPLVRAFVNLGEVGSKYFGRAADAIVGMAEDFDRFIQKAKDSGDLDRWIETAIEGFKDAGRALGGIAGIFGAVSDAARAAGAGGLDGFANAAERISEVMNSERFQTAMISTFKSMDTAVKDVVSAIGGIGPAIESFLPTLNGALETTGETVATLIGYLGQILADPKVQKGVTDFMEGIQKGVENLGPAIPQISASFGGILSILGQVAEDVGSLIATFTLTFGPSIDAIADAFARISFKAGPVIDQILRDMGPVVDNLVTNLLPPLESLITNSIDAIGKFIDKIGTPLASAVDGATSVLAKLGDGFAKAIEKLGNGDTKGALEEAVKGLFSGLGEVMNRGWEEQVKAFDTGNDFGTQNMQFWQKFGERFVEDFHLTMDYLDTEVNPRVNQFFDDFWNGVNQDGGFNDSVNQFFEDTVFKPIREGWDEAWKNLQTWWADVKTNFQNWMNNLFSFGDGEQDGSSLSGASIGGRGMSVGGKIEEAWQMGDMSFMDRFKEAVGAKWNEFWGGIGETIATKGAEFKAGWDGFWGGFGETVGTKWEEIKTTVATKWTELTTNAAAGWEGFRLGWDAFWGGFGETLGTKWEEFKTTVSTKWTELQTGATTAWEGFKTGWSTFWTDAGTTLSTKWEEFKTTVGTKAGEIKTGVDTWAGQVKSGWDTFWGGVGTTLSEKWGEFTNTTSTKAGEIKTNIGNFGTDVKNNWNGFWGDVGKNLSDKWGEFTGTVRDKSGTMKGDVRGMGDDMRGNTQSAMSAMLSAMTNNFQSMVSTVMSRIGDIVGWVSGLPGRISGALGGLGGLLVGAGQSIMSGLLGGLQSMWGQVQGFVGGIASWIAANKGPISYDRVLLRPAGKAIMEGLMYGLKGEMGHLKSTLDTVTDLMSDTIAETFTQSKMYLAGAEAALGLANGLKDNADLVNAAFDTIIPTTGSVAVTGTSAGVGTPTPQGAQMILAEGAVQIITPTQDPEIVAEKTVDGIFAAISNF